MVDIQKPKQITDADTPETVRQIGLSSMNEAVTLMSTDPNDSLENLCNQAISLLQQIKRNNGVKRDFSEY